MRFQLIFLCFASAAMASPLAQIPDSDPTLFDPESTDSGLVVAQVPVLNEPTSQEPGNEYSETNPDSVNYINPGVYTQALCCDISKSTGGMKLPCSACKFPLGAVVACRENE